METETLNFNTARRQFCKFGTEVDLQIVLDSKQEIKKAQEDLLQAEKELDRLEKIFSRFDKGSEVSFLNTKLDQFVEVPDELREIASLSKFYWKRTLGYFDPRIIENLEAIGYSDDFSKISNSVSLKNTSSLKRNIDEDVIVEKSKVKVRYRVDFTGIAKGWFVDRIAKMLSDKGYRNFVVDIGGDMFFLGHGPDSKEWYIDIESIDADKMMLKLSGNAVATSGIGKRKWECQGKRFHHLINPHDLEKFSFDLKSVTVVSIEVADADALAKTIFLMGKEKGLEFAEDNDIACAILDYKGNVFVSKAIRKYII